jgi:hypothetical protein
MATWIVRATASGRTDPQPHSRAAARSSDAGDEKAKCANVVGEGRNMDSAQKDRSGSLRGIANDHLTVDHIKQKMERQFTVQHLQQRLNEQSLAGNAQTQGQGSSGNTQTEQDGGDSGQKKD